uniref:Phosphoinositide phospholipase C n=1 Tax=Panagrolaimus sp. JU765 TaxID=591449 RepID=A0AC34Q8F1_9BILA
MCFIHHFRITFVDLAFLRISVIDTGSNNRVVSQRVVPVKCLRQGYRHLPLRSPANQPLEYSSLFLRVRFEQEEHIYLHEEDGSRFPNYEPEMPYQWLKTDPDAQLKRLNIVKKQIFVLRIQGLANDDSSIIVYAESCSTVRDVIQKALMSAGRSESPDEYYLFEEGIMTPSEATAMGIVGAGGSDLTTTQRMLPAQEPIMDAVVCCWNGSTRRFVLRKKSSDPSGRAWITSIIKPGPGTSSSAAASSAIPLRRAGDWMDQVLPRSGAVSPSGFVAISHHGTRSFDTEAIESTHSMDYLEPGGLPQRAKSMGETFLICIHNVSDNHPYAILRTSINNTATDIIKQIMMKTQRFDVDENDFVLVEELRDNASEFCRPVGGKLPEPTKRAAYRILDSDENVWKAQTRWNCAGRFLLEKKSDVESQKGILKSEHTRKISLSNMRSSMNIPRRISRFGKSLTLDSGKSGNIKDAN